MYINIYTSRVLNIEVVSGSTCSGPIYILVIALMKICCANRNIGFFIKYILLYYHLYTYLVSRLLCGVVPSFR